MPTEAAASLTLVRSVATFTFGDNLTLAAVLISGVAILIFAQVVKRSPFFKIRPVKYEDADAPQQ
jgi:hypothetical protein